MSGGLTIFTEGLRQAIEDVFAEMMATEGWHKLSRFSDRFSPVFYRTFLSGWVGVGITTGGHVLRALLEVWRDGDEEPVRSLFVDLALDRDALRDDAGMRVYLDLVCTSIIDSANRLVAQGLPPDAAPPALRVTGEPS